MESIQSSWGIRNGGIQSRLGQKSLIECHIPTGGICIYTLLVVCT